MIGLRMKLVFTLTLALILSIVQSQTVQDRVLNDFYVATNGQSWTTKWTLTTPVCSRFGVTCTNGLVTSLLLPNNNLQGTIPDSFSNLNLLAQLDLSNNKLFGSIPYFTTTTSLLLKGNVFNCPLPNYSAWSKTTDRSFYSPTFPSCKGSQMCVHGVNGTSSCVPRSTQYLYGSLSSTSTWNRTSISSDKTCCDLGKALVPYYLFSFSTSLEGPYEILVISFESPDIDSYLHIYASSFNPNSPSATNLVSINDDISVDNSLSRSNVYLRSSNNYFIVVSGFSFDSIGKFILAVKGPANYQLNFKCVGETVNNIEFGTTQAGSTSNGQCVEGYYQNKNDTIKRECLSNGEWSSSINGGPCSLPSPFSDPDIGFINKLISDRTTPLNQTIQQQNTRNQQQDQKIQQIEVKNQQQDQNIQQIEVKNQQRDQMMQQQDQMMQQQDKMIQQQNQTIQELFLQNQLQIQTIQQQNQAIQQQQDLISKVSYRLEEIETILGYKRLREIGNFGTGFPTNTLRSFNVQGDRLYVISYTQIKVFNKNNFNFIETLPIQPGGSSYSYLTKEGDLLIPDSVKHVIYKIPSSNPSSFSIFMGKVGDSSVLNGPLSVVIDEDDNIIVLENAAGRVRLFDPSGKTVLQTIATGLKLAEDLEISPFNKNLFVSDSGNNRILIYRKKSVGFYEWVETRNTGFFLYSCTFDKFGNYMLSDYNGHKMMIYERDGTLTHSFGSTRPLDFFRLSESTYLISDYTNSLVRVFSLAK